MRDLKDHTMEFVLDLAFGTPMHVTWERVGVRKLFL